MNTQSDMDESQDDILANYFILYEIVKQSKKSLQQLSQEEEMTKREHTKTFKNAENALYLNSNDENIGTQIYQKSLNLRSGHFINQSEV